MSFVSRLLLVGVCLLMAMASIGVFLQEFRVAYLLRGTANDQIDSLAASGSASGPASGEVLRAFSARTSRDLLVTCGRLMTTAPRMKAEPATARSVGSACGRIAEDVLSRAPSNARARAVSLLAGLPELSPEALDMAQKAAPFEPWPLLVRLDAISSAIGTDAILALAQEDIRRALQSDWGRDRVASLYLQRPDLQSLIFAALEQRPASEQRAFMSALRQASGEAN